MKKICAITLFVAASIGGWGQITGRPAWIPEEVVDPWMTTNEYRQAMEASPEQVATIEQKAKAGDVSAAWMLGLFHDIKDRDAAEALHWFTVAADGGNAFAQLRLGIAYETGYIGGNPAIRPDYALAFHYITLAANAHVRTAQVHLASMYRTGRGTPPDPVMAAHFYTEAANAGSLEAMRSLGAMYHRGIGVPRDDFKSEELLKRAIAGKDFIAESDLANLYQDETSKLFAPQRSVALLTDLAEKGDVFSDYNLGVLYKSGKLGKPDYALAFKWFSLAAQKQDSMITAFALADMYEQGLGTRQDYSEAIHWYGKAAEYGDGVACYRLARLAITGTDADPTIAYMYAKVAADIDVEGAKEFLTELSHSMTPAQIAEASTRADQWRRDHPLLNNGRGEVGVPILTGPGLKPNPQ